MRTEAAWRPIEGLSRAADCKNCGQRIYAKDGDVFQGMQEWRHYSVHAWGSAWCFLDQSEGVYTMADPNLSTLVWLKALIHMLSVKNGFQGHWPIERHYEKD